MLSLNVNLIFTIMNLLVLYLLMKKFLFGPIMRIMEERQRLIQSQLDAAQNARTEAAELKAQYERTLAGAGEEADALLIKAKDRAQADYDIALKEVQAEARRLMKETERSLEAERQKTIQSISKDIAGLAVSVAEKAVGSQANTGFDESMMALFLKEEGVHHG